jgi:UDP-N-acetylglucosamine 2-epimerase (non-hydrolysing)
MKIMSVVGARPNFMKIAPIITAIARANDARAGCSSFENGEATPQTIHHVLVHTGQHYDRLMSDSFFADLRLPKPDVHLCVGSGTHAAQTAEIMKRFEEVLLRERPDILLVAGDVNSTLGCALVAAKISFGDSGTRPLIGHVEAGLRSFDRSMPEEINRILTDQLSDLLFVTEESALRNLANEGVPAERAHFVGNTMIDSLLACRARAEASTILDDLGLRNGKAHHNGGRASLPYALLTLHRPANVDTRGAFLNILTGLEDLIKDCPVVFPAHPRTQKRIREFGLDHLFDWNQAADEGDGQAPVNGSNGIRIVEPLGYLDFLCLMSHAALVVTDSGGIQEETTCLEVPCVTVRENTERPVTLEVGTNVLAGVTGEGIRKAIRRQRASKAAGTTPKLWDGKSAVRILEVLTREFRNRQTNLSEAPLSLSSTPAAECLAGSELRHTASPQ